jgi:DNA polymerase-3 subunit delta
VPLFFLHGENTFALTQRLKNYRAGFLQKYGEDAPYVALDGAKISAREILEAVQNVSLFAEKKMVAVRDFLNVGNLEEQRALADKLETSDEDTVLIFSEWNPPDRRTVLFKKLTKIAHAEEFKPWTPAETQKWIQAQAEKLNGKIRPDAAAYLNECASGNLFQIKNDLEKLTAFAETLEITRADVDLLAVKNLSVSIFALTDALGQKRTRDGLKIFRDLIETGGEPWQIFAMIIRQLRLILLIGDLAQKKIDARAIAVQLKLNPFVVFKTLPQCKNFSAEQLKKTYADLLALDLKLKTGKITVTADDAGPFLLALEKMIVKTCGASGTFL